ncbi:MAG: hypothetical protein KDE51_13550, partial [Anaerolineales bacterium]|nr:hypothetical protein [Anaerolineales bacterium]
LAVLFTIPHNIYAFAGTDKITDVTSIFPFVGVMVIEGTLIFSLIHYTHGWLVNDNHRKAADQATYFTLGVLITNAITAHGVTVIGVENMGTVTRWLLEFYSTYLLPATPILCLAIAARLGAHHPWIQAQGKKLAHLHTIDNRRRDAEALREEAKVNVTASKIEMDKTRFEAEFDAEKISHQADIDEIQALAQREATQRRFEIERERKMLELRETKQQEILESPEFQEKARLAEERQLFQELSSMFQGLDLSDLISLETYQDQTALIEQLRQEVTDLKERLSQRPLHAEEPAFTVNGSAD